MQKIYHLLYVFPHFLLWLFDRFKYTFILPHHLPAQPAETSKEAL
jgi:hypothetical protein